MRFNVIVQIIHGAFAKYANAFANTMSVNVIRANRGVTGSSDTWLASYLNAGTIVPPVNPMDTSQMAYMS